MVISLEMTFLRCFFYNSLILFACAVIYKFKQRARLICLSFILSIANIAMLYIGDPWVFNMVRIAIFCAFPITALGKTSLGNIMMVLSIGVIFCGSALVISQITNNIYIHLLVSSLLALAVCGILPIVKKSTFTRRMTVKISREGKQTISAFVDTGITCGGGIVVVLERIAAANLLTDDELVKAAMPCNKVCINTVGEQSTGLAFVDISNLCIYIANKTKTLPARVMLTDSALPYDALISATSELEASA